MDGKLLQQHVAKMLAFINSTVFPDLCHYQKGIDGGMQTAFEEMKELVAYKNAIDLSSF